MDGPYMPIGETDTQYLSQHNSSSSTAAQHQLLIMQELEDDDDVHQQQQQCCTNSSLDARFSCNICFDAVVEPVVTQCGHLYCWPCLYKWLEPGMTTTERVKLGLTPNILVPPDSTRRVCPVCKAGCSVNLIVPIYVRAAETIITSTSTSTPVDTSKTPTNPSAAGNNNHEKDDNNNINNNIAESAHDNVHLDDNDICDIYDDPVQFPITYEEVGFESSSSSGIRQRRGRTATSDSDNGVPRRPTRQSPETTATATTTTSTTATTRTTVPLSPPPHRTATTVTTTTGTGTALATTSPVTTTSSQHHHPSSSTASLSHGMFPGAVQNAIIRRVSNSIPPIHRPEGFNNSNSDGAYGDPYNNIMNESDDPGATEFLSRLLLMLGSFVILCLLIF